MRIAGDRCVGARLMLTAAEYEIGTHAALAAPAEHAPDCDAAIVAAFGDFGAAAGAASREPRRTLARYAACAPRGLRRILTPPKIASTAPTPARTPSTACLPPAS